MFDLTLSKPPIGILGTLGSLDSKVLSQLLHQSQNSFIDPWELYSLQFKLNLHNKFNKVTPTSPVPWQVSSFVPRPSSVLTDMPEKLPKTVCPKLSL